MGTLTKSYLAGLFWVFVPGIIALSIAACNPSPKAKAILADEEIRAEICAVVFPDGLDKAPIVRIDKGENDEDVRKLLRYFTAYCK